MSERLPTITLSIRQPWAWLIVNGYKDVENRTRCLKRYLGPVMIHASQTCTQAEINAALAIIAKLPADLREQILVAMPWTVDEFADQRGGIVGVATIYAHGNRQLASPWWTGPYGYWFKEARPLPFKAFKGRLGFFDAAKGWL